MPRSPWKTYEVVALEAGGDYLGVVSAALKFHAPQAPHAVAKMQRVQDIGWPLAREQMYVAGHKRKKAIVRPDKEEPTIWE